jgi:hypothetical protein
LDYGNIFLAGLTVSLLAPLETAVLKLMILLKLGQIIYHICVRSSNGLPSHSD